MPNIVSDADKLRLGFPRLAAVHAGARGLKANNVLYAITDIRDGRRVGELELARNQRVWDYLEKYPNGRKAKTVQYIVAALDNPELLASLKAQYSDVPTDADEDTSCVPLVILPDGTRVPYTLSAGRHNYTPEDVANAVLRALNALVEADPSTEPERLNDVRALQNRIHAKEIDITFEQPGGVWDAVMQDSEHVAILGEFINDTEMTESPVVVLGPEYLSLEGPVRFIRSNAIARSETAGDFEG